MRSQSEMRERIAYYRRSPIAAQDNPCRSVASCWGRAVLLESGRLDSLSNGLQAQHRRWQSGTISETGTGKELWDAVCRARLTREVVRQFWSRERLQLQRLRPTDSANHKSFFPGSVRACLLHSRHGRIFTEVRDHRRAYAASSGSGAHQAVLAGETP